MVDLSYGGLIDERREISALAMDYLGTAAADPLAGADLGWFGIGIGEELGGSGGSFADLAPIIEATGARCAVTAVGWTTGVLGRLLVEAGGPAAARYLPKVADGSATVALPLADPAVAARGVSTGGGGLSARLLVHGAQDPTVLLLPLTSTDGPALALVEVDDARSATARLEPLPGVDESRFLHRATVSGASAVVISGPRMHDRLREVVAQVAALDAVGAARMALSATVDYSLGREQFGRPIGSFQAYKHRCAHAFGLLKLAQSAAFRSAQDDDPALGLAAALEGTRNCGFVCGDAVQLHGAIGFSWESGLHAYLKRARSAEIIASNGEELADAVLAAI